MLRRGYTHRIAISNARLISLNDDRVLFRTHRGKTASLPPATFLNRFLDHVLPRGFVRIRHYGLYAPGNVNTCLPLAKDLLESQGATTPHLSEHRNDLDPAEPTDEPDYARRYRLATGIDLLRCPACGQGRLQRQQLPQNEIHSQTRAPPVAA